MDKKVILIADDNEINIKLLDKVLSNKYTIISVLDGEMAIRKAKEIKPSLIVMDVSMPSMDGIQATKILKNDKETKNISIILITAHGLSIDENLVIDSGCDEFITRPVKMNELLDAIERNIK